VAEHFGFELLYAVPAFVSNHVSNCLALGQALLLLFGHIAEGAPSSEEHFGTVQRSVVGEPINVLFSGAKNDLASNGQRAHIDSRYNTSVFATIPNEQLNEQLLNETLKCGEGTDE
jgi:hypothetical protein